MPDAARARRAGRTPKQLLFLALALMGRSVRASAGWLDRLLEKKPAFDAAQGIETDEIGGGQRQLLVVAPKYTICELEPTS